MNDTTLTGMYMKVCTETFYTTFLALMVLKRGKIHGSPRLCNVCIPGPGSLGTRLLLLYTICT